MLIDRPQSTMRRPRPECSRLEPGRASIDGMRLILTIRSSAIAGVRRGNEQERLSSPRGGALWVAIVVAGGVAAACASSPTGSVTGSAWACAGAAPTAGQMVNVEAYSGSDLVASVMTNASHEYTMQLPPGTYTIQVPANAPEGVVDADQVMVTANGAVEADFPNSCK